MNRHTGMYIAGAGVAINLIDALTSRTQDSNGNAVVDPTKGFFYGSNGFLKSMPQAGLILIAAGAVVWFMHRS